MAQNPAAMTALMNHQVLQQQKAGFMPNTPNGSQAPANMRQGVPFNDLDFGNNVSNTGLNPYFQQQLLNSSNGNLAFQQQQQQQQRRMGMQPQSQMQGMGGRAMSMMGISDPSKQGDAVSNPAALAARGSATAPSTPVSMHANVSNAGANKGRMQPNQRAPSQGHGPGPGQSYNPSEQPTTPWQQGGMHHALDSPSTPGAARQKNKKPGRGNKTPVPAHRTPNLGGESGMDHSQDRSGEQPDWDAASSKSDGGGALSASTAGQSLGNKGMTHGMLGQHQHQSMQGNNVLSMPSSMDDMNNNLDSTLSTELGNPSNLGMNSGSGSGVGGADDFASMFGVSDIFDFDFDGGNDGNTSGSGLLNNSSFSSAQPGGAEDKSGSDKLRVKAEP